MTHTSCHIALLLLLSSMQWLGSSLASNPLHLSASVDEVPAIIRSDPSITNLSKRPVLQPKETAPPQFLCTLRNPQGKVCVRAELGVQYVVKENKKSYYFNLNPSATQATGNCGNQKSVLSLEFDGGNLEFTFIKEGDVSYVSSVKGHLRPVPPCKNCPNTYVGVISHDKLFKAKKGQSFQCNSQTTLKLASYFEVKLVPLQIQAFDLTNGTFGKEVSECWDDYMKRIIPIILIAVAVAICLIAILSYVLVREHRNQGYEQL